MAVIMAMKIRIYCVACVFIDEVSPKKKNKAKKLKIAPIPKR